MTFGEFTSKKCVYIGFEYMDCWCSYTWNDQNCEECTIIVEYGETCPQFEFFYPNGVPDEARKRCVECIHLANQSPTRIEHMRHDYRCEIPEREVKRQAYFDGQKAGQTRLIKQ